MKRTFLLLTFLANLFGLKNSPFNILPNKKTDQIIWNESRWQDFIDGEIDPALYVSQRAQLEPDSGCVEFFARFDVDNNGYYDLGCADDSGPYLRLYKGTPFGYFADSVLLYSVSAAGNIDLADLNLDGWAELIHSGWNTGYATIYWGTPNGPSSTNTTQLTYAGNSEAVSVYDLDHDTYLDIIIGSSNGRIYIYWGSSSGYSSSNRYEVNVRYMAGHNIEIGDFDKDGWGDITVALWTYNYNPVIYWGPGRREREIVWLPTFWNNMHGVTVADFNRDGWLDIVYQGYDAVQTSYIYFGSPSGFSTSNRTSINPGKCYGGSAAVDWNYDGWLDIVYLRGNWYNGGTWKPNVYLNTGTPPYFTDANSYELGDLEFNASGGFVADFNFDGNLDIFINNMLWQDSSYILWGPNYTDKKGLPVNYDHHGVWREPGNIYDRSFSAFYFSSIFNVGPDSVVGPGIISWIAYEPPETEVHIAVRGGDTPNPDSTWTNFYNATNGSFLPSQAIGHRYLQYRATLEYFRPCYLPHLEKVMITTQPIHISDVAVLEILQPVGAVDSGTVIIPVARITNYSTTPVDVPVIFKIGNNYYQTRNKQLDINQTDTVGFPVWIASPVGTQLVKCTTALLGDINPYNDFKIDSVKVRSYPLDVGVTAILAPTGVVDSGIVIIPQAQVRNYSDVTVTFPVIMRIGSNYSQTRTKQLQPFQSDTAYFPPWLVSVVGTHLVKCSTALANDTNHQNDFKIDSVRVRSLYLDVGVTNIFSPIGMVDSGTAIIPVAQVQNYSNTNVNFPVTMRIGSNYIQTRTKQLAVGETDTVSFPAWTAVPVGTHIVKCSTALSGDRNPTNDFRIDSVRVRLIDVGVTQIYSPRGVVDSGAVIIPMARVQNYSLEQLTFPVVFKIGTDYTQRRNKTLSPQQSDTVTFPAWTAHRFETHLVKCSTELVGDQNPYNDCLIDSVRLFEIIDAATIAILAPTGLVDSGTVITPKALIANYSSRAKTIPVNFTIGFNYFDTQTIQLEPGDIDTLEFINWIAQPLGYHLVKCSTALVRDENNTNDLRVDSVNVIEFKDAAVLQILEPVGTYNPGTIVTPRATIANYGMRPENIPVICRIGNSYIDTNYILLNPNSSGTIQFRAWTANPLGTHLVKCTTALAGDRNLENDFQIDSVNVRYTIDAGVVQIIAPTGTVDSGTVIIPSAIVGNFGTSLASIPVIFAIGNSYLDTNYILLYPNTTDTIRFRTWYAINRGEATVKCSTALVNDQNPSNDVQYTSVIVRVQDVGTISILHPTGEIGEGQVIPRALIKNYGTHLESFNVVFKIGQVYTDTIFVNGLEPDSVQEVSFAIWQARTGQYIVSCSTNLKGDVNASNDKKVDSVKVWPRVIAVGPDSSTSIYSGNRVNYILYATNLGNARDTVDILFLNSFNNWQVDLLDITGTIPLPDQNGNGIPDVGGLQPGQSQGFIVRVSSPLNQLGNLIDTVTIIAQSAADSLVRDDATLLTRIIPVYNVIIEPNSEGQVGPNQSIEYELLVKNLGNIIDMVDLSMIHTKPYWKFELVDRYGVSLPDRNYNGRPDIGPMPAFGGETRIKLKVIPDSSAQAGEKDTTTIFAQSWSNPLVYDTVFIQTTVLGLITSLKVEWDQDDRIYAGETKTYHFWAQTQGNINDVVNLQIRNLDPEWMVEFYDENGVARLLDSDNDGLKDLGIVRPGEQKWFTIKITAPGRINLIGIPDSFYQENLAVLGTTSQNVKDSAWLRLRTIPNLDVHNFENPFWDKTTFIFSLPAEGNVVLTVFNRAGEKVKTVVDNVKYPVGVHQVVWDGRNDAGKKLVPGTYLYLLEYTDKDARIQRIHKKTVIARRNK